MERESCNIKLLFKNFSFFVNEMNLLEKSCFFCTIILNRFLDIFGYFEIEKLKYKYRNNGTMEKYFVFEFYSKKEKKNKYSIDLEHFILDSN